MPHPPQHRPDAPIIFVWTEDPGLDTERFIAECNSLRGDALEAHPVAAYMRGLTRGDIHAPGPNGVAFVDYLDGTETQYELKRLKAMDVCRARDQGGRVGQMLAAGLAYDGDIGELADARGMAFVWELGEFALRCSEAPRPGEPKRSGS